MTFIYKLKNLTVFTSLIILSLIILRDSFAENKQTLSYPVSEINYSVSFEKPYTHYCEVEISLSGISQDSVVFSMPVWTPGSYLIREFSKNVEGVRASNSKGEDLNSEKISKNSWSVQTRNQTEIKFSYKVYCNELTVRTSEINASHAFLSSAGIFMRVRGFENKKCVVKINLPPEWSKISTGLNHESGVMYSAVNYDILVDSPLEIGNQNILEFEIEGVKHYICMAGKGSYNQDTIIGDFKKIATEEIKLLGGDIPYKDYTYIIHLVERGGGGLEHLNSFVGQAQRWLFSDEKAYKKFLSLVSHEFFHLWNVKRIRPVALGPFDYDNENYTKGLWVAEGWTSFYDNLILRRSDILNDKEYYEYLDVEVNDIMRTQGRFSQSLEQSSFDAWIKYYRKDENYDNAQISYYTKGALVTLMLNLEIIKSSDLKNSLDDALRMLNEDYKSDNSKGYTDQRIKEVCEIAAGKNLDEFWEKYISGIDEIPLEEYLNYAGLKLTNENEKLTASLDIEYRTDNGKIILTKVIKGGSGYESGLNYNDELISINSVRVDVELVRALLKNYKEGDEINCTISRQGLIEDVKVKILKPLPKYKIAELDDKINDQKNVYEKWISGI